jgi:hypothetical protein
MATYLVKDAQGALASRIVWDGIQPYTPPTGCTLELAEGEAAPSEPIAPEYNPQAPGAEADAADTDEVDR